MALSEKEKVEKGLQFLGLSTSPMSRDKNSVVEYANLPVQVGVKSQEARDTGQDYDLPPPL